MAGSSLPKVHSVILTILQSDLWLWTESCQTRDATTQMFSVVWDKKVWDDSHVQAEYLQRPREEEVAILNHPFCINSPVEVNQECTLHTEELLTLPAGMWSPPAASCSLLSSLRSCLCWDRGCCHHTHLLGQQFQSKSLTNNNEVSVEGVRLPVPTTQSLFVRKWKTQLQSEVSSLTAVWTGLCH